MRVQSTKMRVWEYRDKIVFQGTKSFKAMALKAALHVLHNKEIEIC